MKNNKGVTLTSLVIYIVLITVVMAIVMRITTHFSNNMEDVADVAFETEFNKINLYLLDETKKTGNEIAEITQDGMAVSFSKGNRYVYNYTDKIIYLNDEIKICENVETCLFEQKTAENGKPILAITIKIQNIEKILNYVITSGKANLTTTLLPSEYQQVEYIESTGTQYINTEYLANGNTSYVFKYSENKVSGVMFGAYNTTWTTGNGLYINKNTDNNNPFYHYYSNTRINIGYYESGIIQINKGEFYLNDVLYNSLVNVDFFINYPTYIFAGNWCGQKIEQPAQYKLYYFLIYDGEDLVRNFIPCYRKSDGVVGLYDTVNDVFYTNAGTGTFLKGEDIIVIVDNGNEDYINEEDYIFNVNIENESEEALLTDR